MLYKKLDNSQPMSHHVDDASSALYINDPQKPGFLKKLFYTHPPISERIERFETYVKNIQRFSLDVLFPKVKDLVNQLLLNHALSDYRYSYRLLLRNVDHAKQ